LDEATSSVDPENEDELQRAIEALTHDKTSTHEIARYLKITEKAVYRCMDRLKEKVQNDVWIAVFMQLFLVALDKSIFRG
jgi:ATP-binding cassette subfamily B protein